MAPFDSLEPEPKERSDRDRRGCWIDPVCGCPRGGLARLVSKDCPLHGPYLPGSRVTEIMPGYGKLPSQRDPIREDGHAEAAGR